MSSANYHAELSSRVREAGRKKAFTLVELLIVVGIIIVLVAILIPVSVKIIEAGKSAKCMSNMRQIGAAVGSYVTDNQTYPSAFTLAANFSWDGPYWMDQLKTYLPNAYPDPPGAPAGWFNRNPVFYCPAEMSHHPYSDYGPNGLVMYVANSGVQMRPQNLTRPAQTILLADSRWGTGKQGTFLIDVGGFLANPKQQGLTGSPYPPRHGGGKIVNAMFCDGHIEAMSFDDLSANRRALFGADGL